MPEDNFANDTDLTKKINDKPKIEQGNRVVGQVLKIIREWRPTLDLKERENDLIDDRLNQTHSVVNRTRNDRFPSYILQIVRFKTRRRMQLVDFKLEAEGVSEEEKAIVTAAVVQEMKDGGWQEFMAGKRGIYDKITTYGDGFGRVASFKNKKGISESEKGKIIIYQNTQLSKLYFSAFTTDIRNPGGEGDAQELVAIYTYDWETAIELFPDIEELATIGVLPETEDQSDDDDDLTDEQRSAVDQRKIQLGFYYNKRDKIYSLVAGATAAEIFRVEGKKYPFAFVLKGRKGETYIPFLHFFGFSRPQGLYCSGMCTLFYNIDLVWQELLNRGAAYIMENVDPLKIINLPASQKQDFYRKIEAAVSMQERGGRPIIVNEIDSNANPNIGKLETMSAPALTGEFERLASQLNQLSGFLGVKLDDILGERGKPLGTTELELENANDTVKAMLDGNRSELEFAVLLAMDAIARDVKTEDDTPIAGAPTKMLRKTEQGEPELDDKGLPLETEVPETSRKRGLAADSLRKKVYTVKINTASGAVKNNTLELTQINRELADPTLDPRFRKILTQRRQELAGFSLPSEQVAAPQPEGTPAGTLTKPPAAPTTGLEVGL